MYEPKDRNGLGTCGGVPKMINSNDINRIDKQNYT